MNQSLKYKIALFKLKLSIHFSPFKNYLRQTYFFAKYHSLSSKIKRAFDELTDRFYTPKFKVGDRICCVLSNEEVIFEIIGIKTRYKKFYELKGIEVTRTIKNKIGSHVFAIEGICPYPRSSESRSYHPFCSYIDPTSARKVDY